MDFGKVDGLTLGRIDLGLPHDDPRTWQTLRTSLELHLSPQTHRRLSEFQPRVGVGAPVWAVKEWVGKVYLIGAHVVITDVAGRRDVLHTSLPSSLVLIRFICNAVDEIDDVRLEAWLSRLNRWLKMGLEQLEFFVHEPGDSAAPEPASQLSF